MNDLLVSSEFWEENIKTQIFNVVQEYMDDNNLNRKELAKEVGFSKGYISQVLNGDSDHRLSKLVTLALAANKVPYIYLKDLDQVLEQDQLGQSVFVDFEELERKANKCDVYERVQTNANSFFLKKRNKNVRKQTHKVNLKKHLTGKGLPIYFKEEVENTFMSSKTMSDAA